MVVNCRQVRYGVLQLATDCMWFDADVNQCKRGLWQIVTDGTAVSSMLLQLGPVEVPWETHTHTHSSLYTFLCLQTHKQTSKNIESDICLLGNKSNFICVWWQVITGMHNMQWHAHIHTYRWTHTHMQWRHVSSMRFAALVVIGFLLWRVEGGVKKGLYLNCKQPFISCVLGGHRETVHVLFSALLKITCLCI